LEKEDEEVLRFWCLEDDSFSYLVDRLEGKEQEDFLGIDLSFQDFKLYFLRILYSWSHALDGGANLTLLDFVDIIRQGP